MLEEFCLAGLGCSEPTGQQVTSVLECFPHVSAIGHVEHAFLEFDGHFVDAEEVHLYLFGLVSGQEAAPVGG